jgi:hypothetical protein
MTGSQEQAYSCSAIDLSFAALYPIIFIIFSGALVISVSILLRQRGDQAFFFLTSSMTVTSGGARKRMGGPQVPVPRLT